VRELIRIYLEEEGFKVHTADGGKQALEIITRPDILVDILITDILMPHMNGRDLATRVSSIKPYVKVLFISAYSADVLKHYNLCPDGADYIKKPFTKSQLLDRISNVSASSPQWKEILARNA
jgi:DNA-binding response OmpR family regulator